MVPVVDINNDDIDGEDASVVSTHCIVSVVVDSCANLVRIKAGAVYGLVKQFFEKHCSLLNEIDGACSIKLFPSYFTAILP